jgi:hypothetical protein
MFIENFKDVQDMADNFAVPVETFDGMNILIAWYGYGSYCGASFVLYEKDDKLYEVNGSHCSCNGLEQQWEPEETSWEALKWVLEEGSKFDSECGGSADATQALRDLVQARGLKQ